MTTKLIALAKDRDGKKGEGARKKFTSSRVSAERWISHGSAGIDPVDQPRGGGRGDDATTFAGIKAIGEESNSSKPQITGGK